MVISSLDKEFGEAKTSIVSSLLYQDFRFYISNGRELY